MEKKTVIDVFTDGSCNTERKTGGWAAIIFHDGEKIILTGCKSDTTHNRMELAAAIESTRYIIKKFGGDVKIRIFSDSQYLVNLTVRLEKLKKNDFRTKSGKLVQNEDLIRLIAGRLSGNEIEFIKIKAHQKKSPAVNYNREADMLARKIVRSLSK